MTSGSISDLLVEAVRAAEEDGDTGVMYSSTKHFPDVHAELQAVSRGLARDHAPSSVRRQWGTARTSGEVAAVLAAAICGMRRRAALPREVR
jgi:hypothetical protein